MAKSVPISVNAEGAHPLHGIFQALVGAAHYNGGPVGFYSPPSESDHYFSIELTLPDPNGKEVLTLTGNKSGMDLRSVNLTFGGTDGGDVVPASETDRAVKVVELLKARAAALNIDIPG